jgi:hypothetical protein
MSAVRAESSYPRSLLSIAKSNNTKSRMRLAICSRMRTAQISLSFSGDFWPTSLPLFQGGRTSTCAGRLFHDSAPLWLKGAEVCALR